MTMRYYHVCDLNDANQQRGTVINTWPLECGNGRVTQTTILLTHIYIVVAIVWQNGIAQANILCSQLLFRASEPYITHNRLIFTVIIFNGKNNPF
jgi:hypothetical protein